MSHLEIRERPQDLAKLQAVAAIGQTKLIEAYDRTLAKHGRHAAQVLLTASDLDDRARYLNVRNTLLALIDLGTIPVINENDTVAVDELMVTFGDNDRLAALVTNLIRAPLLIMLSDVDGLYDGDPSSAGSTVIDTLSRLDESTFSFVRDLNSGVSKGGMASKLEAARMVTAAGENVIIASGRKQGILSQILAGEVVGTLIIAQGKTVSPWKRWIGYSAQPRGRVTLDAGACRAIADEGRSLLAAGILAVEGDFNKGDAVSLCDESDHEVARGLTNYASADIQKIKGRKSSRISDVLGHLPYEEVIHRDNLLVVGN